MSKQQVETAIKDLIATDDFKRRTDAIYREQIGDLVKRAESKARLWAGVSIALFTLIFGSLLAWQVADSKQRLADLAVQHAGALDSINRFNMAVDAFKIDVNKQLDVLKTDVVTKSIAITQTLANIDGSVQQLEGRVKAATRE